MTIYAVMKTGGKEYRVAPGDVVRVEKLEVAPGATVEIHEVRLIEDGQDVTVGSPTVAGASVVAEVIEEGRGEKIVSFKKKRRNHYQMTIDDVRSYTLLRIREIAVGKSVYAADAARSDMPAAATPPPARLSKRERTVAEPQARKPPQPPTQPAPATPAPIEMPPPVVAHEDAPVAPKLAVEEHVGTQPQAPRVDLAPQPPQPSSDAAHPVHAVEVQAVPRSSTDTPPARVTPLPCVEIAAPAPSLDELGPRKRSYGVPALVVALLVIAAGLLVWGGRQTGVSVEAAVQVAPVAAPPQAQPSVPQRAAKAPPRKETAIKKPAAASAPSAPVQPPE